MTPSPATAIASSPDAPGAASAAGGRNASSSAAMRAGEGRAAWLLLVATTTGGTAWALHLLLGYWLHASGCDNRWSATDWLLHLLTLVALAATVAGMWAAWRLWQRRPADTSGPVLDVATRSTFLGAFGLGISFLFLVAIIYGEVAVMIVPPCT